jgi:hypothetical protein
MSPVPTRHHVQHSSKLQKRSGPVRNPDRRQCASNGPLPWLPIPIPFPSHTGKGYKPCHGTDVAVRYPSECRVSASPPKTAPFRQSGNKNTSRTSGSQSPRQQTEKHPSLHAAMTRLIRNRYAGLKSFCMNIICQRLHIREVYVWQDVTVGIPQEANAG